MNTIFNYGPTSPNIQTLWGYQDFAAGVITGTSVTLTANQNGVDTEFVSANFYNFAEIYKSDGTGYVYTSGFFGLFAGLVEVSSQSGVSITLNNIPDPATACRIWYLFKGVIPSSGYILPPQDLLNSAAVINLDNLFLVASDLSAVSPISYNSTTGAFSTSMATNRLIGRYSASTGVMQEISLDPASLSLSGAGVLSSVTSTLPMSTGVITGGDLSIGTGGAGVATTFTIAAGSGQVVDNTVDPFTVTDVSWSAKTNVAVTNILTQLVTYVAIDSGGNVIQQASDFTPSQLRDYIVIGVAVHSNQTTVNAVNQAQGVAYNIGNQFQDLTYALKLFNIDGNTFSANGANLKLNKSSGSIFRQGSNYSTLSDNPHVKTTASLSPVSLRMQNQTGAGSASTTDIDPDNYDVGGVTTIVPANKFTVLRVFLFQSNLVAVQRGQVIYNSLAEAKAAIQTENYVTNSILAANGLLRGFIAVRRGTTDLINASDAFFIEAGKFGGSAGVGGLSVSTLQNAYDNSLDPEILTDSTRGALTVKRGSAADTDNIYEGLNGAGTTTFKVDGNGKLNLASLTASQAVVTDASKNLISLAYASADTVSTIVARDSNGDFSAGAITLSKIGTITDINTSALLIKSTMPQFGLWDTNNGTQGFTVYHSDDVTAFTSIPYAAGSVSLWMSYNHTNSTQYLFQTINVASLTPSKPVFTDASRNLTSSGILGVDQGGLGFSSYTQGDLFYASDTATISKLAKNASATRYLSNTGASNNPAWAQIDLTNGVTGILPNANTTATSANTASAIVTRDASGNFNAGNVSIKYLSVLNTGTQPAVVISSSTVGSANAASLYLDRGDQTNGNSILSYSTLGVDKWHIRLSSGSDTLRFRDMTNSVDVLSLTQGAGTTSTSTIAGVLNVGDFLTCVNMQSTVASGGLAGIFTASSSNLTGLQIYPFSSGGTNDGVRLYMREDSSANYGFSLGYNGANAGGEILNWGANSFNITRHNFSATGVVSLTIARGGGMTISEATTFSNATASTSTTTGSLINAGGFGNAGTAYIGGNTVIGASQTMTMTHLLTTRGLNGNLAGPHFAAYTATDQYPLLQLLNWQHDNVSINFDSYYDGAWRSSDAGSNYQITKFGDQFRFTYATGIAAGSVIAFTTAGYIDTGGILQWQKAIKTADTTASTNTTTGSGVFAGGVAVGGAIYIGGAANVASLTASALVAADSSKNLSSPSYLVINSAAVIGTATPNLGVSLSNSGGVAYGNIRNTSNTASSDAKFDVRVGGASAGDPFFATDIDGTGGWSFGLDNSDSDSFKLDYGAPPSPGIGTKFAVDTSGAFYPGTDNAFTLGKSGRRWSQLWAGTTTINTSDGGVKNSISTSRLGLEFINALTPREFKFNPFDIEESGINTTEKKIKTITPKRIHFGFVAQEVKQVLDDLKIDTNDFAGYVDPRVADPDDISPCGLRYSEFIAPLVHAVQELSAKVTSLQNHIDATNKIMLENLGL